MNESGYRVDEVVEVLARHSQRATYGAVGGLVGLPAQSVMSGKPRTQTNSCRYACERSHAASTS